MRYYDTTYINQQSKDMYNINLDDLYKEKELKIIKSINATVYPIEKISSKGIYSGGVCAENGEYISLSGWYRNNEMTQPMSNIDKLQEDIENSELKIIYCGVYIDQFGHFLLESTSRLWYYLSLSEEQKLQYKCAFLCYSVEPNGAMQEFLELCGLNKNNTIYIKRATKFKEVIIPEISTILGRYYTKEFMHPFQYVSKQIEDGNIRNIYLTRTQFAKNKNTYGEEYIETVFRKNKYKIISPEQLTLKEQISLVKGAQNIAMLNGSACHLLLFAKSNINSIIINRFSVINKAQTIVDSATKIKTTYIDAYWTFLPVTHGNGPFGVFVSDNLLKYLKVHNMRDDFIAKINKKDVENFLHQWNNKYIDGPFFQTINNKIFYQDISNQIENIIFDYTKNNILSIIVQRITNISKTIIYIFKRKFLRESNISLIKKSKYFDKKWYKETYKSKMKFSAAEDYLERGWKEGCNPSQNFDGNLYIQKNIDVKRENICPLLHYEKYGKFENRNMQDIIKKEEKRQNLNILTPPTKEKIVACGAMKSQNIPISELKTTIGQMKVGLNTGNMIIGEYARKNIKYIIDECNFPWSIPCPAAEFNEKYTHLVIFAANWLSHYMKADFSAINKWLKEIKIPVTLIGLGCQYSLNNANYKEYVETLPPTLVEMMHIISSKSHSISVRGKMTADLLNTMGIDNVNITGCPTWFLNGNNQKNITLKEYHSNFKIAFHADRDYVEAYNKFYTMAKECADSKFILQSEFDLLDLSANDTEILKKYAITEDWARNDFVKAFTQVKEWEKFIKTRDFVFGMRIHGTILSLKNNIPALLVVHDARTKEFAELLKIPNISINEILNNKHSIQDLYASCDYTEMNKEYKKLLKNYKKFLTDNKIPNIL